HDPVPDAQSQSAVRGRASLSGRPGVARVQHLRRVRSDGAAAAGPRDEAGRAPQLQHGLTAMAGSAQPVPASLTWTDGLGSAVLYATTGRLDNWTPDAEDIGVRVTLLGTGQTARFVYRRDYTTTFEMSALSPASMLLMHRFKLWAESGGQFTVNTQDRNQATYSCLIKPDYQIQWTLDRQTLTYTMQVGARNAAAASMACQYTSFLGTGYTITVTPNPLTMGPNVGNQVQLTAVVSDPSGAAVTIPVVWSSSNPAVASVDQTGTVTALTTGSCNIIASAGGTATAVPCAVNI